MDTQELLTRAQELAVQFVPKIAAALVIVVLGRWFARAMSRVTRAAVDNAGGDPILVNFLSSLVYTAPLAMVVVAVLGQLGVQTTSFIAMLGAAGLAPQPRPVADLPRRTAPGSPRSGRWRATM